MALIAPGLGEMYVGSFGNFNLIIGGGSSVFTLPKAHHHQKAAVQI